MKVIGCGDSWAWGAELVNKEKHPTWKFGDAQTNLPDDEAYRCNSRYLNLFANKINADEVITLAKFSYSNDAIVRTLIEYLSSEGYLTGRDTSDIFVSIGWTSPERRELFYKKPWSGTDHWVPMGPWPMGNPNEFPELQTFQELYIENFWNVGEFIHRWINQIWHTELILKTFKIKYVMHQAFYHHHNQMIYEWDDIKYFKETENKITAGDKILWESIDPVRYINKTDLERCTFHHCIVEMAGGDKSKVFAEWHPNELGHQLWADYMYDYCEKNKLL